MIIYCSAKKLADLLKENFNLKIDPEKFTTTFDNGVAVSPTKLKLDESALYKVLSSLGIEYVK